MKITRIGMDLAKQVFVVHGVDEHERSCLRKKLPPDDVRPFFAKLPPRCGNGGARLEPLLGTRALPLRRRDTPA